MATMIIPTAALVVLMSPIVLPAMADMGLLPVIWPLAPV